MADPTPTLDPRVAAHHDYLNKLSHKVDAIAANMQVQRAQSRADSADDRSRDDDDRRIARLVADAVAAAFKQRDDDMARRQKDDAEVPPEQCEEEPGEAEPEPMSADDDRVRREDDRRDRRADSRRQVEDDNDRLIAQSEWGEAFMAHGERAPPPGAGWSARTYRQFCANKLKRFSDDYKNIDLGKLPGDAFRLADRQIRADALAVANNPQAMQKYYGAQAGGLLREIKRRDRTGREISEFIGPVDAVNGMFKPFELAPMRFRGFDPATLERGKRGGH